MAKTRREVIDIAKREISEAFADDCPVQIGLEEFRRAQSGNWLITIGFKLAGGSAEADASPRMAYELARMTPRDPIGRIFKVVEIDPETGDVAAITDRFLEPA
jgi:hypothetical protein